MLKCTFSCVSSNDCISLSYLINIVCYLLTSCVELFIWKGIKRFDFKKEAMSIKVC